MADQSQTTAPNTIDPVTLDWWIVFDTLREAQKRLEKDGVRHSWMDGAVAIAKGYANV